jgi:hypothetical protein
MHVMHDSSYDIPTVGSLRASPAGQCIASACVQTGLTEPARRQRPPQRCNTTGLMRPARPIPSPIWARFASARMRMDDACVLPLTPRARMATTQMWLDVVSGLAPALGMTLKHTMASMLAQELRRWPLTDTTTPELLRRH